MIKEIKLIKLYGTVCHYYDSLLAAQAQRMSNNDPPVFTDAECLTIYLFGLSRSLFTVKAVYDFIKGFFPGWFPRLPSYQAFNHRICFLSETFRELCGLIPCRLVAIAKRSGKATAAPGLCAKDYCASQNRWYYRVKIHVLGQKVYQPCPG